MINDLSPELYRVIDANLNRLREGIRVVEDIARYLQNTKALASKLKSLRHKSRINELEKLLISRDSLNDVLRSSIDTEMNRSDLSSIIVANYKRAEESSRVLEEMYKIINPSLSENFKNIRYELYALEKEHLIKSV
jgi:thiamine-phosphate pyrophosphorylase